MKIVYFDYWVKGIFHFKQINKVLNDLGHQTLLLHISSFRNVVPNEEIIDNLNCYDIKHYKTSLIYRALEIIQPDIIITLNTTSVMDRALILAAKKLNIKTVFIMHGVIPVGSQLEALVASDENLNNLSFKLSKAKKYVEHYLPNYLFSLYKYNPKRLLKLYWLRVVMDHFKKPRYAGYFPIFSDELIQNKCLVYADVFKKYYEELGYPSDLIGVVGNPANSALFNKIESGDFKEYNLPIEIQELIRVNHKYAVYIDDGLYINQIDGWDINYMKSHLELVADKCRKIELKLIVKVRPKTDISDIFVDHSNILFVKDIEFFDLVFFSSMCIGHVSTALQIPIMLKKPIIVPYFMKSTKIPDYFISNKVANAWINPDDDFNLEINDEARKNYIQEYISITDSSSVDRIIKHIEDLKPLN